MSNIPEGNLKTGAVKRAKVRWIKIAAIFIGSVFGLLAILIFLLPTILSSEIAKGSIVNIIETYLNREVEIKDLNMSWSGGLDIKDLLIKEKSGLPGDTFIKVDRFYCDMEFFPLIRKQFKIKSLVIDRPEIVIQRDKNGRFNYEDIGKSANVISSSVHSGILINYVEANTGNIKYSPLAIPYLLDVVLNVKITNGKLTFIDHRLQEETVIRDFNTSLNVDPLNKPIGLKSTFNIDAKGETEQANITLNVSLAEEGKFSPENIRGTLYIELGFAQLAADFDMARFRGKGGKGLYFSSNIDLRSLTEKLAGILGLPEDVAIEGIINSKITAKGRIDKIINVEGNTTLKDFKISGGPFGDCPFSGPEIRLIQNADIDLVRDNVRISEISAESNFAKLVLVGLITNFSKARNLDLQVLLNCDLSKLMIEIKGLLPKNTEFTGSLQSNMKLKGPQNRLEINGKTKITNLFVRQGNIGPIIEPEIRITHNAKFDSRNNNLTIKKLTMYTSFMQTKSSGSLNNMDGFNLNTLLVVPDIKKLLDTFNGIVSLPQGLTVNGKAGGEINAKGNINEKITISGKTILHEISATGGFLKDAELANLDLKFIHTFDYNIPENSVNIEKMDIVSNFFDMNSKGKITKLNSEMNIDYKMALNFDLDNSAILFADLLPAGIKMRGKGKVDLDVNGKLLAKTNKDLYKNINLNGNFHINEIEYGGNIINGLGSKFQLDDGYFSTKDFAFKINNGQGNLLARVDLNEAIPTLDFGMNLSNVNIDQKLKLLKYIIPAFSTSNGRMSGTLNMMLTAHGKGLDWQKELSKGLNAHGDFNIKNGSISGDGIISKVLKRKEFKFDDISSSFKVSDGKIYTDNLRANGKDFNIGLSGWTSFDGRIEYSVKTDSLNKHIGRDAKRLLGLLGNGPNLPIRITGTVDDPKIAFQKINTKNINNLIKGIFEGLK